MGPAPYRPRVGDNVLAARVGPAPYRPRVGDNVLARFERNQWYLAHVVAINGDRCDIYFPEDSLTRTNVRLMNIKPVVPTCTEPRRRDLIGKTWNFPGDEDYPPGVWTVRRMVGDTYICVCADPKVVPNTEPFDIGYVISCYKHDLQKQRERRF